MRNLAIVLFLSAAVTGCGQNHGASSRISTPLDKILVIGQQTQGEWQQFMKTGGLQNSDQWRGYTVQDVSLGFDAHDKLSEISLLLTSGTDNQEPSFGDIKQNLAGICGKAWKKGSPSTALHGNILCIFSPARRTGYYHLEISKMEHMNN